MWTLQENTKTYRRRGPVKPVNRPVKRRDVPTTYGLLFEVRQELKSDFKANRHHINAVKTELKADFRKTNLRIDSLRTEFKAEIQETKLHIDSLRTEVKAEIQETNLRLDSLRTELKADIQNVEKRMMAGFEDIKSAIHRLTAMVEEQRAQNVYVLDGYTSLFDRQERLEKRWDEFEKNWSR
jgi:hypothetical protein